MSKFVFTKRERIYLLLAFFVFLTIFLSSSMTFNEQHITHAAMSRHFSLLEKWFGGLNIYYGGVWHNSRGSGGTASLTEFILRKLAHFFSYLLLGLFTFLGLRRTVLACLSPILIWLSVTGLAAFDEFHQFLTGDRTPSVHDVVLDSLGATCGIAIALIFRLVADRSRDRE